MRQVVTLLPLSLHRCPPLHVQVYGLQRLVRGLGSGRQGARQGYALALGKLLSDVPALPVSQVLTVMSAELDVSGRAKVHMQSATVLHVSVLQHNRAQVVCNSAIGHCALEICHSADCTSSYSLSTACTTLTAASKHSMDAVLS